MACSIILRTVCQSTGSSLEYKESGLHYHFGNLTFWQLKSKKGHIAAIFSSAYMPVCMYLVICKKPVALDNCCDDDNSNSWLNKVYKYEK